MCNRMSFTGTCWRHHLGNARAVKSVAAQHRCWCSDMTNSSCTCRSGVLGHQAAGEGRAAHAHRMRARGRAGANRMKGHAWHSHDAHNCIWCQWISRVQRDRLNFVGFHHIRRSCVSRSIHMSLFANQAQPHEGTAQTSQDVSTSQRCSCRPLSGAGGPRAGEECAGHLHQGGHGVHGRVRGRL